MGPLGGAWVRGRKPGWGLFETILQLPLAARHKSQATQHHYNHPTKERDAGGNGVNLEALTELPSWTVGLTAARRPLGPRPCLLGVILSSCHLLLGLGMRWGV